MTKDRDRTVFTIDEVALHNKNDDCWTVIDGDVYDVSHFVRQHPGGSMIIMAAGADATVLFHTYHITAGREAMQVVLNKFRIGSLDNTSTSTHIHNSPIMGKFYDSLSTEVALYLRSKPRYPVRGQVLFVLDLLVNTALILWGSCCSTSSPLIHLVALWVLLTIFINRLNGQGHALGHMQIFSAKWSYYANLVLLASGSMNYPIYALPNGEKENYRRKLNRPRPEAQFELGKVGRGLYEHQSLHHVMAADLSEDQCYKHATKFGFLRLSTTQPFKYCNQFQYIMLYRILVELFFDTLIQVTSGLATRIDGIMTYWAYGDTWPFLASFVGIVMSLSLARIILLLPSAGREGLICFSLIHGVKYFLCISQAGLYFAQHKWDEVIPSSLANTNWGMYNTITSFSLIGENLSWHPFLWFQFGSSPSTLTYHAEHTLFPGVNYLYLPAISHIVQRECIKFGIRYNKLNDLRELESEYSRMLYAYSHKPKP